MASNPACPVICAKDVARSLNELWRQEFIYGLAHTYVCAETIAVGVCTALRDGDFITSTDRGARPHHRQGW
ncbi:MAG: hypothetical protein ACC726_13545 [Chloroflexota bacterium]